MHMLFGYLYQQEQERMWQAYTAQMLWYQNHATYAKVGKRFDHPTWLDMIDDKQTTDERSGQQIVDDLVKSLQKRKKKRERRE